MNEQQEYAPVVAHCFGGSLHGKGFLIRPEWASAGVFHVELPRPLEPLRFVTAETPLQPAKFELQTYLRTRFVGRRELSVDGRYVDVWICKGYEPTPADELKCEQLRQTIGETREVAVA